MNSPLNHLFRLLLTGAILMASVSVLAQSSDELVNAAREAARADRNFQSADLFEQALAKEPTRRREWLREYTDQLTYSQRAVQAVTLYREYLAAQPETVDRRRGLQGLALALSWSDQPSESRVVYEALLAEDPGKLLHANVVGLRMSV